MNFLQSDSKKRIAVIGAGAAGLVAARECLRQGFEVKVFEKSSYIGGVWQYNSEVEDDLLGQNPKKPLHGSLYKSLCTNLPRKLMAFRDFPFEAEDGVSQFVSHERAQAYLDEFVERFDLQPVIEFDTSVESLRSAKEGRWRIKNSKTEESLFDAAMVCNGHYSNPRVPEITGMETFEGVLMHSHNYRTPDMFKGKRVALFGAAASALDLSVEISQVAEQVYWCAEEHADIDVGEGIVRCGAPKKFESRNLELESGEFINDLDAFIFCTGYLYRFSFLEDGIVNVVDNWVHPLYMELIPPAHPTIAFVGLPYAVIPFPLFEVQVKWFTQSLAGKFDLPSKEEMDKWCDAHADHLCGQNRKQRNFHKMGAEQYAYMNRLARDCGSDPLPYWFQPLAEEIRKQRLVNALGYRDMPYECTEI
ncbi:MAG: NAD(P)-binding domain-containing protein [Verrucomicrobia bacterium]|nr:NAD(P)-binding domain-containing protein [Verrucomicrobiota bacterium]